MAASTYTDMSAGACLANPALIIAKPTDTHRLSG
ncbi:hypothetical protein MY10362_003439 [Beauveria mimosiformis]